MKNHSLEIAMKHWVYIKPVAAFPKNDKEFKKLVSYLDKLLDIIGDDENHSAIGLVDVISNLIASYEEQHYKKLAGNSVDALKHLMEIHNLKQSDLSKIVSQGVLSEILNGKRSLSLRHIKLLSKYFSVDPSTFID